MKLYEVKYEKNGIKTLHITAATELQAIQAWTKQKKKLWVHDYHGGFQSITKIHDGVVLAR